MIWAVSGLQSIAEKLHFPVSGFGLLRLFLVLLGTLLILGILEWRFQALTRFLNEKSTALNLAVARVAVAATLLWQMPFHGILLNTSLDPVLRVPFKFWGALALHHEEFANLLEPLPPILITSRSRSRNPLATGQQ